MENTIDMIEMAYYIGKNNADVDSYVLEYLQTEPKFEGTKVFANLVKYMVNDWYCNETNSIYDYVDNFTREDFNKFIEILESEENKNE